MTSGLCLHLVVTSVCNSKSEESTISFLTCLFAYLLFGLFVCLFHRDGTSIRPLLFPIVVCCLIPLIYMARIVQTKLGLQGTVAATQIEMYIGCTNAFIIAT
jgi:hypothetical protein